MLDMLPLCIAVIPWGILCGSIAVQMGLSPLQAQAMSAFVFAGAAQLSGVALIGAVAPAATLFSTTFMISARHLLYSANFRQYILHLPFHQRVAMAFLLTDEMYALVSNRLKKTGSFDSRYAFIAGATFYAFWNLATLFGIVIGQYPGIESLGLDFAIAATFIALIIPMVVNLAALLCVMTSALLMFTASYLAIEQALLIAVIGAMLVGYCCERWQCRNNTTHETPSLAQVMHSEANDKTKEQDQT